MKVCHHRVISSLLYVSYLDPGRSIMHLHLHERSYIGTLHHSIRWKVRSSICKPSRTCRILRLASLCVRGSY